MRVDGGESVRLADKRQTKAIASPSKFVKFQAVLLGEQKATASATALVAKSAVRGAEARCFLVRPVGS